MLKPSDLALKLAPSTPFKKKEKKEKRKGKRKEKRRGP
jgi:hypothetical protein